jgi:hypothetical protein
MANMAALANEVLEHAGPEGAEEAQGGSIYIEKYCVYLAVAAISLCKTTGCAVQTAAGGSHDVLVGWRAGVLTLCGIEASAPMVKY